MDYEIDTRETVPDAVVICVSVYEDQPLTALPPLFESIDPDALSALWNDPSGGPSNSDVTVTFTYSDSHVVVENGETVTVTGS